MILTALRSASANSGPLPIGAVGPPSGRDGPIHGSPRYGRLPDVSRASMGPRRGGRLSSVVVRVL